MAKLAALAILLLFSIAEISLSSAKKPSAAAARREDIPFIRCQVCHKIAEQIYNQVEKKQAQISPKKVSEYQIIEIAENVCNLKKEEADWILQIDIVEKGDKLEDRIPGEAFVAKPAKDAEMEKIMRSMEGMPGAPSMKMYSRDDIMNNRFGDEDGDDEDDDDEDKFPGKLGNILREKESSKKDKDLKQKILQGVKDAGKVVKGHVNKVSKQLGSWWRGKKTSTKTSKKGKSEL
ncbi:uncharacterized protein A4U43_C01F2990 [Asparagus officinalis]|uniref:Saposin B-type domain-containing protein n=1 Tax=Asparagus officinalis TaxID=4686 RepID=A0A5P1FLA8_ASPOF|nr:uncharacterized protein A4U43_C01F2990 [Asparagus officinalis]